MLQIESQLSRLRLHGMSRSWQALLETRRQNELTLSEGLELLLQAEEQERTNMFISTQKYTSVSLQKYTIFN